MIKINIKIITINKNIILFKNNSLIDTCKLFAKLDKDIDVSSLTNKTSSITLGSLPIIGKLNIKKKKIKEKLNFKKYLRENFFVKINKNFVNNIDNT